MVQERSSIWPLLFTATCLLVLSVVPPFFVDGLQPEACQERFEAPRADFSDGPPIKSNPFYSDLDNPVIRQAAIDALVAIYPAPADEIAELEPTEPQPAAVAGRVATEVAEKPPAKPIGEGLIGPQLTVRGASDKPAAPVPTESVPPKNEPIKTAMLTKLVRRLPAAVANLRKSHKRVPNPDGKYTDTAAKPARDSDTKTEPTPTPPAEQKQSWPKPIALMAQLQALSGDGPVAQWSDDVTHHIEALGPAIVGDSDEAQAIIRRLNNLATSGHSMAGSVSDRSLARNLRRAAYALQRRIDVWVKITQLGTRDLNDTIPIVLDAKKLARCLAKLESITGDSDEGDAWRKYLLIGPLKENLALGISPDEAKLRENARRLLIRLSKSRMTAEQYQFVTSDPVAELRHELKSWAAEPISFADLLRDIERYEQTGLPSRARRLAMDCQSLSVSPLKTHRNLAAIVDFHYRNANFRVAVTEELLNDLIPEQKLEYAPVRDTVLDRPTRGKSLTATEAAVRMRPDPKRVSLTLEVTGEIQSYTTTDAGIAKFHNNSKSYYIAKKTAGSELGRHIALALRGERLQRNKVAGRGNFDGRHSPVALVRRGRRAFATRSKQTGRYPRGP